MFDFDLNDSALLGPEGSLPILPGDEISWKLAMLYEGQCTQMGPTQAAAKYGYSKQRYYQLLHKYLDKGALGLLSTKRGPKSNYRRTDEVIRQVIRHRFLDPDATSNVIAQKLNQCGFQVSDRTVRRVFENYGLQKKTLQVSPRSENREDRDAEDEGEA